MVGLNLGAIVNAWRNETDALGGMGAQPRGDKDFFPWIRCNPLKSPVSAKGIQETASFFPWFYLVLACIYLHGP
jgi:hypothetical protein